MEKSDQLAACAVNWNFVNQLHARAGSKMKLASDIVRAEGNVMDAARRIFLKKLRDGTIRAGWFKEFEVNFAHGKEGSADLLRGNFFTVPAFQAQRIFIVRDGLIQ